MPEPAPPDRKCPRYSARPFPFYRFVPGHTPHPRRHPDGHSYGQPEVRACPLSTDGWQHSEDYLHGIDLYNFGYWWESHEIFESFWHAAGHSTEQGRFFRALIQLAAGNLKNIQQQKTAARTLLLRGISHLRQVPSFYMGVQIALLIAATEQRLGAPQIQAPLITLDLGCISAGAQGEKTDRQ